MGTDPTGTHAEPNDEGVEIDGGATTDVIGTNGDSDADAGERDVIGGNTFAGVWIDGVGTAGNVVAGDLIGTNVTGDKRPSRTRGGRTAPAGSTTTSGAG